MTGRNEKATAGEAQADLEAALERCWVVLILDPDWSDTSPWSVVADDIGQAVTKAVAAWTESQIDPDDPEPEALQRPHVVKIYRRSWITRLEWCDMSQAGLGTYDMSKLSNPRWD